MKRSISKRAFTFLLAGTLAVGTFSAWPEQSSAAEAGENVEDAAVYEEVEAETYTDQIEYVYATSQLVSDYPCDYEGTLEIDINTGEIQDQDGETVDAMDDAVEEAVDSDNAKEAAEVLEENGYAVLEIEGSTVSVENPYQTMRLIVDADSGLSSAYGAEEVLQYESEYILQFSSVEDTVSAYTELSADETVDTVYTDAVISLFEESEEESPSTASLSDASSGIYSSWGVKTMGLDVMQEALENSDESLEEIIVADIDTGVNYENTYLGGRVLDGYDFYNDDDDAMDDSSNWHGTHVAGIIADGTSGNVKILPVKVFGSSGTGTVLTVRNGLIYAVDQGADIINLSLGMENATEDYFQEAFTYAADKGCMIICAAGNDSGSVAYPASSSQTIAVSAIDETLTLAAYSNYGDEIDFCAPGTGIESAYSDSLGTMSGTSMAAPHVSAAAALLKTWNSALTNDEILEIMESFCVELGDEGKDSSYGYGCIYLGNFDIETGSKIDEDGDADEEEPGEEDTTPDYLTISGQSTPGTMTAGSDTFTVSGIISSKSAITSVTVAVYDTSGNQKIAKTVSPNAVSYDLSGLANSVLLSSLSAGVYTYKVTAANKSETTTLVSKVFIVLSTGKTVSNGTYYIVSKVNSSYCLSIKSDSNSSGANVHLWTKKDHSYMKFKFAYQSGGYYTIQDVGSGMYLSVAGSSSSSGANIQQTSSANSSAALWQILPDGTGSYYLVPKCGTSRCMDLKSAKAANGQNIQSYTANLTNAQRWTLTTATVYTAPTISGQSTPGTLTAGKSFTIKGTISSTSKITSVTVAVYDTNGNKKIGKTVSPNATSYSLSKVDSSIKFGGLSAGVYTYKVTATNSWGTKTLVSKVFIVLSTGKTVANGTYYISSNVNTKYCLSIKSDSKSSGANVHLWTKKSHSYMRFKFVYQSNGYYKIQDVGSGKYLSVSGSSSSSGANVQQSSSATLWQVLPDGTGSYYLVPKCGTSRCLDLKSAKAANGQNIQIYTANMTKAQRWKLTKS